MKEGATNKQILKATVADAKGHQDDYYYIRNLPRLLDAAKNKGFETLKRTFIVIIDEKIKLLDEQITGSSDSHSFFQSYHASENAKRSKKMGALGQLKAAVESTTGESKFITEEALDKIIDDHAKVFQSFFKDTGDVEVIFNAAREYFLEDATLVEEEECVF